MKLLGKRTLKGWGVAAPMLMGIIIFYIYPLIKTFYYSLYNNLSADKFVGLRNYYDLFTSQSFILALKNTMSFYIISIPLILSIPLIMALSFQKSGHTLFLTESVFFSILLPSASLMLFVNIVLEDGGIINNIFKLNIDIYNSPWALVLLIILYVYKYGGFNYFIYTVALQRIDKSYYEEALINGASKFQCFRYVTMPFVLPYIVIVIALSVMNSYKIYREAYLIGGYYPHESIYLFQHYINNNFLHLNYSRLCCVSIIIFVSAIIVAMLILYLKKMIERRLYEKKWK